MSELVLNFNLLTVIVLMFNIYNFLLMFKILGIIYERSGNFVEVCKANIQ